MAFSSQASPWLLNPRTHFYHGLGKRTRFCLFMISLDTTRDTEPYAVSAARVSFVNMYLDLGCVLVEYVQRVNTQKASCLLFQPDLEYQKSYRTHFSHVPHQDMHEVYICIYPRSGSEAPAGSRVTDPGFPEWRLSTVGVMKVLGPVCLSKRSLVKKRSLQPPNSTAFDRSNMSTLSIGPLTTTFTAPPSCLTQTHKYLNTDWNCQGNHTTPVPCGWLHLGNISDTSCFPSSYTADSSSDFYYSPGICPTLYSTACSNVIGTGSAAQTIATCCPEYVIIWSSLPFALCWTNTYHPVPLHVKQAHTGHGSKQRPVRKSMTQIPHTRCPLSTPMVKGRLQQPLA